MKKYILYFILSLNFCAYSQFNQSTANKIKSDNLKNNHKDWSGNYVGNQGNLMELFGPSSSGEIHYLIYICQKEYKGVLFLHKYDLAIGQSDDGILSLKLNYDKETKTIEITNNGKTKCIVNGTYKKFSFD